MSELNWYWVYIPYLDAPNKQEDSANTLPTGFHATLFGKPVMIEPDRLFDRFELLMKWSNRWMKLAKQFKEAK